MAAAHATTTKGRYALADFFPRPVHRLAGSIDNQKLVHARFGKKRGLRIGEVERLERDGVWLQTEVPWVGDGVVFDRGRPDEHEEGGRITTVDTASTAALFVSSRAPSTGNAYKRATCCIRPPTALDKALRQSYEVEQANYKRPIRATVRRGRQRVDGFAAG